jgi:NhaA family Na+:H+ antiporter
VAVPVFALLAAGVVVDGAGIAAAVADPVAQGVVAGLVIGKPVGILLFTFLVATFTRASLDRGLSWWDVLGMSALAGIGFTVSLLIGDLAFAGDRVSEVKMAVLTASLLSALIGSAILVWRDRFYRSVFERRSTPVPDSRLAAAASLERELVKRGRVPAAEAE